jgi:hypothetical protein
LLSLTEARPQIKEDALEIAYVSLFQRDESYGAEERREVKAFSRGGIKGDTGFNSGYVYESRMIYNIK